ncbi:MAG: HEAT repeat domain-containing protein [Pseudomonadota bacterium]
MASTGELESLIEQLAIPHRAKRAYWRLVGAGSRSLPAVRRGLSSAEGDVRMHCARILDHIVDEDSIDELVKLLDDPDPRVRVHALHALACDRCKDNACRPAKDPVLPKAIDALLEDPDAHVRAMAVEVVGRWMHTDEDAVMALEAARDQDDAPAVRKKAGWYAPGGTIYRKRMTGLNLT